MLLDRARRNGSLHVCLVAAAEYDWHPRLRRHAEALVDRGDRVTAMVLGVDGRPDREVVDGVQVERLRVRKYRGASLSAYLRLYLVFALRAMVRLARRWREFDVIHVSTLPEVLVFAAVVPRLARTPVVLDIHDRSVELFTSKFGGNTVIRAGLLLAERLSYGFACQVLTVHEPYARKVRALTAKPVTVVLNSPDERLFKPRGWRGWDPGGEVVYGYHGLLARRHGLLEAIEALSLLRAEFADARLRLWGSGDDLDVLRETVRRLGLTSVVDLPTAAIPLTRMVEELSSIHIGLVPSLSDPWTESVLPTKLLEYASLGIPVITFRNPVIEAFFSDDCVTYVDPVTPQALAVAMATLAHDTGLARFRAANAQVVMRGLAWDQQKHIYLNLVDSLVR